MRREDVKFLYKPVIQRPVDIKFKSTYRMSDILYRVTLSVRIVIHRIDTPFVTCTVMVGMDYTVHNRVTEHHIRMRHIDLCPEDLLSVRIHPCLHLTEKSEVLFPFRVSGPYRGLPLSHPESGHPHTQDLSLSAALPTRRAGQNSRKHTALSPTGIRAI